MKEKKLEISSLKASLGRAEVEKASYRAEVTTMKPEVDAIMVGVETVMAAL